MGMTLNGGSSGSMAGISAGTVTIKKNTAAEQIKKAQSSSKKRVKKKLNYNPREISSQLLRATRSTSASLVLARARSKLSVLSRCRATGQYDDAELRNAMVHARRMINCSRTKMRNLREEEQLRDKNNGESRAKKQQKRAEIKRRVHQKERNLKTKAAVEENHRILAQKRKQQELRFKKRLHRAQENGKIFEADMKYLKDQMNNSQGNHSVDYGGVVVDISAMAAQLQELQMMEQQIEQEVELEIAMESGGMDAGSASAAVADGGAEAPVANTGGAAAVSVDVSV